MNSFEQFRGHESSNMRSWPTTDEEVRPRLVFVQMGVRCAPSYRRRSTEPEKYLADRQRYLLETFPNSPDDLNVARVESFIKEQGLRVAPYIILSEADAKRAVELREIEYMTGSYKATYDVALIPRHTELEAVNGAEFMESVVVHELFHGTNAHHDIVYIEGGASVVQHGRSGHRVYDCHGRPHGLFLEEAGAERQRGKFVEQVLEKPHGFAADLLDSTYFLEDAAMVDAKYTIRRTDGTPHVITEAFAAQTLDLLCRVDPGLEEDLRLARHSAGGLRRVATRLNNIHSGLYAYLRDVPYSRESYRQCLVHVQKLVSHLSKKQELFEVD